MDVCLWHHSLRVRLICPTRPDTSQTAVILQIVILALIDAERVFVEAYINFSLSRRRNDGGHSLETAICIIVFFLAFKGRAKYCNVVSTLV